MSEILSASRRVPSVGYKAPHKRKFTHQMWSNWLDELNYPASTPQVAKGIEDMRYELEQVSLTAQYFRNVQKHVQRTQTKKRMARVEGSRAVVTY